MGDRPFIQIDGSGGINNIDPARNLLTKFLTQALNIDIDNVGNKITRGGQTEKTATGTHSLFANKAGDLSLFVQGTTLYRDLDNPVVLRTDLTSGLPMSYTEFNDKIIYSNNQIIEYTDGLSIVSFDTAFNALQAIKNRDFKAVMRAGQIVEAHGERLYVIRGNEITFSDAMNFVSKDKRFYRIPVNGYIRMFKAVPDGVWLSFGGKTYFMSGIEPKDFQLKEKSDYSAIGQAIELRKELIGVKDFGDVIIGWASENGICIGGSGGQMINLSSGKYKFTGSERGAVSLFKIENSGIGRLISVVHN